ncbi:MAG TPA: hypothetical protein VK427_27580 [Kofleriaceae bacterium]|nr:hypothetical protein [Kofleriaceae bacterium]
MRRARSRLLAVTIVSACGFSTQLLGGDPDAQTADAGPCAELGDTCVGSALQRCVTKDQQPTVEACAWGCVDAPSPHCGAVVPGGALLPSDLVDDPRLQDIVINAESFNSDDGSISGVRAGTPGYAAGIEFVRRGNVGVFRVRNLTLDGAIAVAGSSAIAIVALGTITVHGAIDVQGTCSGSNAGPGGTRGGTGGMKAPGTGGGNGGLGGAGTCSGGAGGAYGALGGSGGASNAQPARPAPGTVTSNPTVAMLAGGAGGGGGGGEVGNRGQGGGGGGAMQLFATGGIVFTAGSIRSAGGCGGNPGQNNSCGGGGGAGGAILLEGPTITLASDTKLAVNGGGGGGGNGGAGEDGQLSLARASKGASGGVQTGEGGSGGASDGLAGLPGQTANNAPGGGGGGVGWIRFHTLSGSAAINGALLSPRLTDPATTTTQGTLTLQ